MAAFRWNGTIVTSTPSEKEFRGIIKTIVQTGNFDGAGLEFTQDQKDRINAAVEIYRRRDKTKPLTGEFVRLVRIRRSRHEISECPKCGRAIWVFKVGNETRCCEPGTEERHVCYHSRVSGSAFERNRRKH